MFFAVALLLLAALICFILAALNVPVRVNLIGLGLACTAAANLIRVFAVLVLVALLSGCAATYELKNGNKFSVSASPDSKQIRAVGGLLF